MPYTCESDFSRYDQTMCKVIRLAVDRYFFELMYRS